eukprot:2975729-Rhodomonas_salina.1
MNTNTTIPLPLGYAACARSAVSSLSFEHECQCCINLLMSLCVCQSCDTGCALHCCSGCSSNACVGVREAYKLSA